MPYYVHIETTNDMGKIMKTEQLEMEVGTNIIDEYTFKHKAIASWQAGEFDRFDTYIRTRINKWDEGLINSVKTVKKNAKKGDLACLTFAEKALDAVVSVSIAYIDDRRVAVDKMISEVGTPIYKKFLNAERVRKNKIKQDDPAINLKTSARSKVYIECAEQIAKDMDFQMQKGDFISLLLKLGSDALSEHITNTRATDSTNTP